MVIAVPSVPECACTIVADCSGDDVPRFVQGCQNEVGVWADRYGAGLSAAAGFDGGASEDGIRRTVQDSGLFGPALGESARA